MEAPLADFGCERTGGASDSSGISRFTAESARLTECVVAVTPTPMRRSAYSVELKGISRNPHPRDSQLRPCSLQRNVVLPE
eukprot:7197438-Alexandrium_andersonii.AAC.1